MKLEACTGDWLGYWVQGDDKGQMEFDLHFHEGKFFGGGRDRAGFFAILDGVHDANGAVTFVKHYKTYTVDYVGVWDGDMITGLWHLQNDRGAFEIWPRREVTSIRGLQRGERLHRRGF